MSTTRIVLGLVLLLSLAACSAQEPEVVVNEQVPAAQQVADTGEEDGGEEAPVGEPDATWVAEQLAYIEAPTEMPSGDVVLGLEIIGGLPHNVVFEGVSGDAPLVEGGAEGFFTGAANLAPGEYVYYCSIAGHREAGMEGSITVT